MILLLSILLSIGSYSSTPLCDNYFPKIIGGKVEDSWMRDFDVKNDTIYMCGATEDAGLTGYTNSYYFPMVAATYIQSTQFKWAFTDRAFYDYYIALQI